MVNPSKILTVSYGAFSCTLEGFDEPFVMMKAVAEYFRDLAAEDRYFGAEPPKPDEAMLQRIAEREIQRRVEAKVGEQSVAIRQLDGVEAPAPVAAMAEAAPAVSVAPPAMPVEPAAAAPLAEVTTPPMTDAPAASVTATDTSELPQAPAIAPTLPVVAIERAAIRTTPISAQAMADAPSPDVADDASDSIAAKLKRIRAVVESVRASQPAAQDEEPDVLPTTPDGVPGAAGFARPVPDGAAKAATALERLAVSAPDQAETAHFEDDESTLEAEGLDMLRASFLDDEDETGDIDAEDAALRARIADIGRQISPQEDRLPDHLTAPGPQASSPTWDRFEEAEPADEALDEDGPDEEEPQSFFQRARARVLRIGKTTLGRADAGPGDGDSVSLGDGQADEAGEDAFASDDAPGDELSRLMEEARQKLDGAENRRRFTAISHLKAAVAATLADRQMQVGEPEVRASDADEDDSGPYREDLSRAVRPQRPLSGRPQTSRPILPASPLVLVSEQRVDLDPPAARGLSVQPRRMSVGLSTPIDEDEDWDQPEDIAPDSAANFAQFAERLGANSLTELLEAAAVYTASIEGQPYFTRPHLLRKVQFVSSRGSYNREDGLRSFGTLLREGKILKISRGQFAVAEASKYMIETRRAAH